MNQSQINPIMPILTSTVLGNRGKAEFYYAKQDAAGEWMITRAEATKFWAEQANRLKAQHRGSLSH
ncbi:hypothetical protein PCI56_13370 [Plesiomonas shigelloides subsp. oncorhynchi]|uniref:hypothetical protein n=1 Tax=Plesiomonas shigelloides TaxID=703 RepID=UPI001E54AA8F|nr:hypothetical protein [Plesiomonas shigelloides]MDA1380572.1 hypothetical protein [Plesiomonas shigelloides]